MADTKLYGPDGKLLPKSRSQESALSYLEKRGISTNSNGDLVVPKDALQRYRMEKLRDITMTGVPSTPRFVNRDGGGLGVQKGHARFETFSLRALRKIRERSPMLQPIHAARHYQVRRLARKWSGKKGDVGWRVVHKDHTEHDAKPPKSIEKFIERFERMFMRPSARYCQTTSRLLTELEEDYLTINRPVVEILYSMFDDTRVAGWRAVDAEMIWPTLLWVERWQSDNPQWYGAYDPKQLTNEQVLYMASEAIDWDLHGVDFCLVRDGVLEGVYRPNQLIVAPNYNRTDITVAGYPPSHVEMGIEIILSHINTWDFNSTLFTRGMMAEFILGISGDVHDDDVASFVDMLREATQGVRRAWQPPVMTLPTDGTIQKIDLKGHNKDMLMELWFSVQSSLCAAIYRMDMSTVNMKPWDGGAGPSLSEPNRHDEIALAKEEGLQGDVQHLTENIFNPLARRCHPDLRVIWEYGDFDPKKEAEIYEVRSKVDMTRNQVRLAQGELPMGFWMPLEELEKASDEDKEKFHSNLWNMPADPSFASSYMQAKMQEQMAQQGEEAPMDDGFGETEGDDADGFGGGPGPGQAPFGQPPGGGGAPSPAPPGQPMNKADRRRVTVYVEELENG